MTDEEAERFLSRLAASFREPYKDERAGWLEWLLTGFVELELATETLNSLATQRNIPRLPAFKVLYSEFHRTRERRAARGKKFPDCELCGGIKGPRGTIQYVRGGFSSGLTKPIHKDRPKNFPYLSDAQFTFCYCEKGKSLFLEARPGGDWQKHIEFVFQVAAAGSLAITGKLMDECRKLSPEKWEDWQGTLGSFKDLPLADTAPTDESLMEIPM
jgi:hypothetical protein